jgi:hypothetical protein
VVLDQAEILYEAIEQHGEPGLVGCGPAVENLGHVTILHTGDAAAESPPLGTDLEDPHTGITITPAAGDEALGLQFLHLPTRGAGIHVRPLSEFAQTQGSGLDEGGEQERAGGADRNSRRSYLTGVHSSARSEPKQARQRTTNGFNRVPNHRVTPYRHLLESVN